ncbi:MAG: hypothetical protein A2086_15540 [Spirochaetes bacterium GWD1_27_9]|nr:MAG: hypothetical protein A2Z98_14985 [Spirochaetes bacterium GWB1_27_13]OHD42795.1 MAG: hypothetical protein A2086_15540 [Spirochaetes bacterium GWD1_27_9]
MKKMILLFILISAFLLYSKENKDDNQKKSDDYKFELKAKTDVEFKIVDTDNDPNKTDITASRNTPEIEQFVEAFVKVKKFSNENFIFGPFVNADFIMRFDYNNISKDKNYEFFIEKFFQTASIGLKIGYKIDNTSLLGSYFLFNIPFSNYLRVHDEDDHFVKPTDIHEMAYSTNVYLGSQPAFILKLKPRIGIINFDMENYGFFAAEITKTSYKTNGYFFEEKNILNFEVAPFNLINREVDVWFGINNKFIINNDSSKTDLYNRAYFNIVWNGLKFFEIGFKPIVYKYEIKIPNDNISLAYDQEQYISMEASVRFSNKNVDFKISYEPTLWGIKKTQINDDNIKSHIIKTSLEFKF